MSDEISVKDKETIQLTQPSVEPKSLSDDNLVQEEILINLKEKAKEEKTKVNSRSNDFLKRIIDTPKEQPGGGSSATSNDDAKKRLLGETQPLNPVGGTVNTEGENSDTAELIIECVDWLLVAIIHWFSMSDSDKDYQTSNDKKKILKKYFAKWLEKKAAKYPVEFFLIAAFLSTYFISAKRAYSDRQINEPIKIAKEKVRRSLLNQQMQQSDKKKRKLKDDDLPFTETEVVK